MSAELWYYIASRDGREWVVGYSRDGAFIWDGIDMQGGIPYLFNSMQVARRAASLVGAKVLRWPYLHPSHWARERERIKKGIG